MFSGLGAPYNDQEKVPVTVSDGSLDLATASDIEAWDGEDSEAANSSKAASLLEPIGEANKGFLLMLKMGWVRNTGLGPAGRTGRLEPVPFVHKADSLGVGKGEEYDAKHVESTRQRKALESEVLAAENAAQRAKREAQVEQALRIKEEIKSVTRAFYCELCNKQYTKISEYEVHLSSYDHNHKQRFKDMQEMSKRGSLPGTSSSNKRSRDDKEKAREEREFKRLQEAASAKEMKLAQPSSTPGIALQANSEEAGSDMAAAAFLEQILPTATSTPLTLPTSVPPAATPKVSFGFGLKKATQPVKFSFGKK